MNAFEAGSLAGNSENARILTALSIFLLATVRNRMPAVCCRPCHVSWLFSRPMNRINACSPLQALSCVVAIQWAREIFLSCTCHRMLRHPVPPDRRSAAMYPTALVVNPAFRSCERFMCSFMP